MAARFERLACGVSLARLATLTGVDPALLSKVERGLRRLAPADEIRRRRALAYLATEPEMPRSRPGKRKCSQKILARARVYSAVASGRLTRPEACSACGRVGAVQGHHDDYSKPLEVTWLCVACHRARHASTRRAPDLEFAATEAIQ